MSQESGSTETRVQDALYQEIVPPYSQALSRLARAYEADPERRRDLLQDIHFALWRSFTAFDRRCSVRTWVYRVAHNVAATHVLRARRSLSSNLVSLDEAGDFADSRDGERTVDEARTLERLALLIHRLNATDRQVIVLYLEDLPAIEIADVTGLSAANVATKIHRIKHLLARSFHKKGKS